MNSQVFFSNQTPKLAGLLGLAHALGVEIGDLVDAGKGMKRK
jgi:hypothetical protein